MKEVIFSGDARSKLLEGVNMVAKAVSATLGPKGRNCVISRNAAPPVITNDGVTIAASFNTVVDPYVNTGVQMIKEVSTKQNEPGDGTTTATILAAYLVNEGVKQITSGSDPIEIKDGIESASREVIAKLKSQAKQISTEEEMIQIATIAVEDKETGKLIGEMMHQVGKDGAITVETSKDVKLEKDIAQGMKFDQGFLTPYFMTNPYRQEAVYEDMPILVTDHTISINEELAPLADGLLEKGIKGLVIICDNMKAEALTTAVKNTVEGVFNFLVISLPGLDEQRTNAGQDIAVAVGAKFISKDIDKLLEIKLEDLGEAERIISKQDYTVIVKGGGTKQDIDNRVKVLKEEIKSAISDYDRDQLKERIARLSGGIGVLRIGAATEQELMYKKHKIEDALAATRAAIDEGIVVGGGVALLRIAGTDDGIIQDAIRQPISHIASNAGKNADTIVDKILAEKNPNFGWDAKTDTFKDLFKAGIVDPVKVTRKAIENAVSMAIMFLTCESLIIELPEEKKEKPFNK